MSINFPNAPAVGETFTSQGRTFVWTGEVWILQPQSYPWASSAEALAGTAADRVMSPAMTKLRADQIPTAGTLHPFMGTPTNMLASRAVDTAYWNDRGRPMCISVWGTTAITLRIGATETGLSQFMRQGNVQAGAEAALFAIVPRDWWYSFTVNATAVLQGWTEYR